MTSFYHAVRAITFAILLGSTLIAFSIKQPQPWVAAVVAVGAFVLATGISRSIQALSRLDTTQAGL